LTLKGNALSKVERTCPCGKVFQVPEWKIRAGRGKRCSKACQYKYATRPSGLKYEIKQENKGWFKEGEPSPRRGSVSTPNQGASYGTIHRWVRKCLTKSHICEWCGSEGETQWANKSHEYMIDLSDWVELCRKCHRNHDSGENRGKATMKFGKDQVQNNV
jgi:hypothetical protein